VKVVGGVEDSWEAPAARKLGFSDHVVDEFS